MLIPCASRITLYDGSEIGGDDDCVLDKGEIEKYMGTTFQFYVYYN